MSSGRDEVLRRIRTALADRPAASDVPRAYRTAGASGIDAPVALFAERVADYRATVHECATADVAEVAARLVGEGPVVVADGFPAGWLPDAAVTADLDDAAHVLTTCAVAIAVTGTIVLDHGPGQGRRALTLVPDHHVVVVRTEQIVASVPDAIAVLDPTRPQTWISGPSATSDIELQRVEGVHGPRVLDVIVTAG